MIVFTNKDGWAKWPPDTECPWNVGEAAVEVQHAEDGTRWVRPFKTEDELVGPFTTDFNCWQTSSLVKFAEDATAKLAEQEREIAALQDQVRTVHLAWKNALREVAAIATLIA
jgi:hypothetical protein